MLSYTLRLLILFAFSLSFNILYASEQNLEDLDSDIESEHLISQARFEYQHTPRENGDEAEAPPTGIGQDATPNATFASNANTTPPKAADIEKEEEFISVPKHTTMLAKFSIVGRMFDTLVIPLSTMPYTEITLSGCSCFNPLNPNDFQNNPSLTHIILNASQLNLRLFEEIWRALWQLSTH